MKNKLLILLGGVLLTSCSEKQESVVLTDATYVIFYSDSNLDTLNVSTTGILKESSYRGTNEIYIIDDSKDVYWNTIYENSAPFKRIKFKQTIIK